MDPNKTLSGLNFNRALSDILNGYNIFVNPEDSHDVHEMLFDFIANAITDTDLIPKGSVIVARINTTELTTDAFAAYPVMEVPNGS